MKFKDNIPIYLQIKDLINQQIVSQKYPLGAKIPSVRDLSVQLEVNINTIQKALTELIREGIIETKRGRGNFVTENPQVIDEIRIKIIQQSLSKMYESLSRIGLDQGEMLYYIKTYFGERMAEDEK
ncbi:GntR family transcriptional regulator [Bombilactobacillus folatiphilus]|uniref:GntR family transcriptional regulator n=1 Tax=Bombilactobacillus folatiphilus TaxID=2923362 RepID=A0ABY4P9H7_9LACO|nr:GntR family transcriptional regulator [Bombilactobacillus folatiphilus]UQS82259.1 GntR family transcriptional regulator [Bombilactobacillus folatiphilus]